MEAFMVNLVRERGDELKICTDIESHQKDVIEVSESVTKTIGEMLTKKSKATRKVRSGGLITSAPR